jgi:hypothetical protein
MAFRTGTGPCTDSVGTYRSFFLCHALPFPLNMNGSIQPEGVPSAVFPPEALCRAARRAYPPTQSLQPLPASSKANKSLTATAPKTEIDVTHSYKRRKHFLTATKKRGCSVFRCLVPGRRCFAARTRFRLAETPKINRKLESLEPVASHSKQRTDSQVNRKPTGGRCFPFSDPNRKPKLAELLLTPAKSASATLLIANFEPFDWESHRPQKRASKAALLGYLQLRSRRISHGA